MRTHLRQARSEEPGQKCARGGERDLRAKRAYKTELKPNRTQEGLLARHAGAARFAYNWGLARKREAFRLTGRPPNAIELHRELNSLKKTAFPWLYEVSKCAPQEALRDLDRAFAHFFSRCKQKKEGKFNGKAGFPRFKSRKRGLGSFRLTGSVRAEERRIKLPRLGWIRLKERGYLPAESDGVHILSATVSERAGRWFVSLQVEEEKPDPTPASGPPAGVDLGVRKLATCSHGEGEYTRIENPGALITASKKLRKLQKKLSRQVEGSNRRQETKRKIARLHYRISCMRSDAVHKATSRLVAKAKPPCERPYLIGIEDLNVSGMMKNRRLARAVADASMREFRRQIAYKCSWYGVELVTVPRFQPTSKPCSRCGWLKEDMNLSDLVFHCESCGHTADRDENASDNIRLLAVSSTERINGRRGDVRPLEPKRQMPEKRQLKQVGRDI